MQVTGQYSKTGLVFDARLLLPHPNLRLMQKTIFIAVLQLLSVSLWGQDTFHKGFNGGELYAINPLNDGGFLGVGLQSQPGFYSPKHGLVARLNDASEVIWRKRYPRMNYIWYSAEANDGFVIVGDTVNSITAFPHRYYSVVSKLSNNGDVVWSKIIGDTFDQTRSTRVIVVPNGHVISGEVNFAGFQGRSKSYFVKIDNNGNTLWSKVYFTNNPNYVGIFSAQLLQGDTLYACGQIQGNGCFIRINVNTGALIDWSSLGGIYREDIKAIKPTQDGNFLLAGSTRSTTGSEEDRPWVTKVNRNGQLIWSKVYNIIGENLGCQIEVASDGNFLMSIGRGIEGTNSGYAVLAKIDESGNLLWAYNYSDGQWIAFEEVRHTPDGGFLALSDGYNVLKTDPFGRVNNGCCPAPVTFQVKDYLPPYQDIELIADDWGNIKPFNLQAVTDSAFTTKDFCEIAITSLTEQIFICPGDSVQINGIFYQAPQIVRYTTISLNGGCDTVRIFNLIQIPQPFKTQTVSFCPGTSVVFSGITYTQPATIHQILPAATACDTLLVTYIQERPLPKKYETTTFCPGETVFVDGIGYQYPIILPFPDTLPGPANGCDTLLYQQLAYPSELSSVSVICPPNLLVSTAPATPILVNYIMPTATSTCICPEPSFFLQEGLSSGALFPVGETRVCYSAYDICGEYKTCCFEINVQEDEACDVKETSCIRYELLDIHADAEQNRTYRVRITNQCNSPLTYTAIQIPNGIEALAPLQNIPYISYNGREYAVRNPNFSPFHSLRFKAVGTGIAGGESDIFEYTLPAQASPTFVKATTRLNSGLQYEATFNTFGCSIQSDIVADRARQPKPLPMLRVFPNPTSGELFVDLSKWTGEMVSLRLLNEQGQELAQRFFASGSDATRFPLPATLANGFYMIEMRLGNGVRHTARFVLQR